MFGRLSDELNTYSYILLSIVWKSVTWFSTLPRGTVLMNAVDFFGKQESDSCAADPRCDDDKGSKSA
jgi:hypothetical protein